jgi:hypothetical protein
MHSKKTPLTFGVDIQYRSEVERADGDVGWDSKQEVERFPGLFVEHCFFHVDGETTRWLSDLISNPDGWATRKSPET